MSGPRAVRHTKRKPLIVTHDDDGGLTVHDMASDIVVSIIGTHPLANGPKTLFIEVYPYETSRKAIGWTKVEPTRSPLKPTFNFWTQDRPTVTRSEEEMHEYHVDLRLGCVLCEFEAGNQQDRLTDPDKEGADGPAQD